MKKTKGNCMENFKGILFAEYTYKYDIKKGGENYMYWLTGLAGAILMAAPYIFGYSDNTSALWTSLLVGLVVVVASIWEGLEIRKNNWEYWVAGIVGIFAILAPFLLGFGSHQTATWTSMIMGGLIAVLAGAKLVSGGGSSRA